MIANWFPVSSPDNVKPPSWRIRLPVFICAPGREPRPSVVRAVLDTGSPWSVFTEEVAADHCGIRNIETGRKTTVSWVGTVMPAWQHRVKLVIKHSDSPEVATVLDDFPLLFVHSYVRPGTDRPFSLALLGADFFRHVLSFLNGPEARLIM